MSDKALIIEDDEELAALLVSNLDVLGFGLACAHNGNTGLELALSDSWAFVLIDMMLPGLEGSEICKRLRAQKPNLPIIMLTACSDELSTVLSLELGADDYITKPFSFPELKARIRSVLRRSADPPPNPSAADWLVCGDLVLNVRTRTAHCQAAKLELTCGEFDLLALLAADQGRVFSRNEIVAAIHGSHLSGYEATITSHINRIRAKLESDPANPKYLQTVRGRGYRLVTPDEE